MILLLEAATYRAIYLGEKVSLFIFLDDNLLELLLLRYVLQGSDRLCFGHLCDARILGGSYGGGLREGAHRRAGCDWLQKWLQFRVESMI